MNRIQYHIYNRELNHPLRLGNKSISNRCGIFVRIGERFGEAAPLEGHSIDSLADNLSWLLAMGSDGVRESILNRLIPVPPAMKFALECIADPEDQPILGELKTNGLIGISEAQIFLSRSKELSLMGFTTIKVKLNPSSARQFPDLIELNRENGIDFMYRLDGNRSFTKDEFQELTRNIEKKDLLHKIEYIEEPCENLSLGEAPIKIAADESAFNREQIFKLAKSGIKYFILKPTILGGVETAVTISSELLSLGAHSTITSTLETSVGRRHIIHTLMKYSHQNITGLATGDLFQLDFLPDSSVFSGRQYFTPEELRWLNSLEWETLP